MGDRRLPGAAGLIGAVCFFDALLYGVLAPLLPHYAAALELSEGGAGVLVAAYPAGVMVGSLPAGWISGRIGVRPTTVAGLALLALSSICFAFADSAVALDAARFVQGLGSAAAWTAGLAWLAAATPEQRRGGAIGAVIGLSVAGTIVGPALGVLAGVVGVHAVFVGLAAVSAALAAAALKTPGPAAEAGGGGRPTVGRAVLAGAVLVGVVGLSIGAVDVIMPLRLDALGASRAAIGATFVGAAVLQAALSPKIGDLVDRRGAKRVSLVCLAATTVLATLMPLPTQVPVAAVALALTATVAGGLWVPGMTLLGRGAEVGASGFAVGNMVWSAAEVIGAAAGGHLAQVGGHGLPFWLLAGLSALVLVAAASAAQPSPVTSTRVP